VGSSAGNAHKAQAKRKRQSRPKGETTAGFLALSDVEEGGMDDFVVAMLRHGVDTFHIMHESTSGVYS
jgi:hypothetical protein